MVSRMKWVPADEIIEAGNTKERLPGVYGSVEPLGVFKVSDVPDPSRRPAAGKKPPKKR